MFVLDTSSIPLWHEAVNVRPRFEVIRVRDGAQDIVDALGAGAIKVVRHAAEETKACLNVYIY